ncbi:hypothetical protein [Nocardioides panzhihuensis]|uniref:Uncharacterized protein n=1 Tax=Nocardioides panzhihuensis TaxID=860243 RepID=A0A7Z0DTK1_9ACTN|nr:hypothetical protein [Nocardioides panzhihuensis]NYI81207.1 hypothetical protein [Nocardioides panzhihuensis]
MPAVKGRRHGEHRRTAQIKGTIRTSTREKANAAADALGISVSAYLDALIDQDQVDATGKPLWGSKLGRDPELELRMTG